MHGKPGRQSATAVALALSLLMLSGCLQRRIRVLTDPPGATVWLNDTEVGRSPTDTEFTFFGEYDVRAVKEGYVTLNTTRKAVAPWYEYPIIDLLVVILPFEVETTIEWTLTLEKLPETPQPEDMSGLLERANQLRREVGVAPEPENGK